ncbi:MAG: 5'-methylthioadenosine/S-adenosylhomocysteine nucleosidase [Christensenellaceae bacterium]|nr:5'-methylthioadenosine/S-adenosylhomocysteine nucleosidase [Christensenellaceae bacterium]
MNRVGILCATPRELQPFLPELRDRQVEEYAMHAFHTGSMEGLPVVAVCSGCGKINAAVTAQALIDRWQTDAVIFSGIAGGMTEETCIFNTVVCTASSFHDTNNDIYTDFPVMPEPVFYADERLLAIARSAAARMTHPVHYGPATTGDIFTGHYPADALCIDMETAAAAHACYLNRVPFIAIRSISDNREDGGQEAINRNYDQAARMSACFTREMLREIKKQAL